jgi:hypothetical protein
VGLVARVLEATGIPAVVVSTARDISAQVKAPRTVFANFPMGNPFGRPFDRVNAGLKPHHRAGVKGHQWEAQAGPRAGVRAPVEKSLDEPAG